MAGVELPGLHLQVQSEMLTPQIERSFSERRFDVTSPPARALGRTRRPTASARATRHRDSARIRSCHKTHQLRHDSVDGARRRRSHRLSARIGRRYDRDPARAKTRCARASVHRMAETAPSSPFASCRNSARRSFRRVHDQLPTSGSSSSLDDSPTLDLSLVWRQDDDSRLLASFLRLRHAFPRPRPHRRLTGSPALKIAAIETISDQIPYTHPLAFASGSVCTAPDHVLVRVTTTDGVVGSADAPPRPYTYGETQSSIMETIGSIFLARTRRHEHLRPREDPCRDAPHDSQPRSPRARSTSRYGTRSERRSASPCIDCSAATPIRCASRTCSDSVPPPSSSTMRTGWVRTTASPPSRSRSTPSALTRHRDHPGTSGSLGDEVELYLDANRGWTANEAAEVLRNTTDCDLTMLEEPCDAKEGDQSPSSGRSIAYPVVADESAPTAGDASRELLNGGCSAICIKTARSGFTEATGDPRSVHQSRSRCHHGQSDRHADRGRLPPSPSVRRTRATSRRAGELSNFLDMSDDLILDPIAIRDGRISVRETAGVGADIDEEKLAAVPQ